jgi:hypothetical protein
MRYEMGDGRMPEQVEQYRLSAEKCLELAQTFNDLEAKRTMLAMADAWLTLLHNASRTSKRLMCYLAQWKPKAEGFWRPPTH